MRGAGNSHTLRELQEDINTINRKLNIALGASDSYVAVSALVTFVAFADTYLGGTFSVSHFT